MRRWFRRYYQKFISLEGAPKAIALGFAVGTFVSFNPVLGTHTILALLIASIFRMHLGAMLLGTWVGSNPITIAPAWAGQFFLGKWLLRQPELVLPAKSWNFDHIMDLGWGVLISLLLGGAIIGATCAVLSYPAVKWSMKKIQAPDDIDLEVKKPDHETKKVKENSSKENES